MKMENIFMKMDMENICHEDRDDVLKMESIRHEDGEDTL